MAAAKEVRPQERGLEVADADAAALALEDVELALPNGRVLLEDLDLVVEPGERLVIQGPSGSGKTTLFRVLAGPVAVRAAAACACPRVPRRCSCRRSPTSRSAR